MAGDTKNINSDVTDESGCIASNLPYKAMRIGIENKGIFSNKKPGALYCFTGKTHEVKIPLESGGNDIYKIPETFVIDGPDELSTDTKYAITFTVSNGIVTGGKLVPIQ